MNNVHENNLAIRSANIEDFSFAERNSKNKPKQNYINDVTT